MIDRLRCENLTDNLFAAQTDSSLKIIFEAKTSRSSKKKPRTRQKEHFCSKTIPKAYLWLNFLLSAEFGLKVTLPG